MQRASGVSVSELASKGEPAQAGRQAVAAALFRFCWGSALRDGLFNADPNPGNFLIDVSDRSQPKLWCLDFGCVVEVPELVRDNDRRLWWGLMDPDAELAAETFRMALYQGGILARNDSMASNAHRQWEQSLIRPYQMSKQFLWDRAYSKELADTTSQALSLGGLALPAHVIMLWRQRLGAAAVLGMISANFDARAELLALIGNGKVALR
jgi:predicted unusual protein kinase regulating ubiquinone biosynthesis (AarF/ABC1/UbiB family)